MALRELSKDELIELWESGVPLDSAWIEFATFLDSFSIRALRTHPNNDRDLLAPDPRYKNLSTGWLPQVWEDRQKKLETVTRNERLNLLDEIYAGRLWALGFRTLSSGFDELVRIPRHLFLANDRRDQEIRLPIDWNGGVLRDGDTCYFDIRIVRPPVVENESAVLPQPQQDSTLRAPDLRVDDTPRATEVSTVEEPKPGQVQLDNPSARHTIAPPSAGRPNKRDRILSKAEELLKDPLFRAIPNRTDQARELRARLCGENARHLDDMQGYRTTQIKRIIGEVANTLTGSE